MVIRSSSGVDWVAGHGSPSFRMSSVPGVWKGVPEFPTSHFKTSGNSHRWYLPGSQSGDRHVLDEEVSIVPFIWGSLGPGVYVVI